MAGKHLLYFTADTRLLYAWSAGGLALEATFGADEAGLDAFRAFLGKLRGSLMPPPPETTALGALYHHVTHPRPPGEAYVPMNINFGLLPPLPDPRAAKKAGKHGRRVLHAERAQQVLPSWLAQVLAA